MFRKLIKTFQKQTILFQSVRNVSNRLSQQEIQAKLSSLPNWKYNPESDAIESEYTFKDFKEAFQFLMNLQEIAYKVNLLFDYLKVR